MQVLPLQKGAGGAEPGQPGQGVPQQGGGADGHGIPAARHLALVGVDGVGKDDGQGVFAHVPAGIPHRDPVGAAADQKELQVIVQVGRKDHGFPFADLQFGTGIVPFLVIRPDAHSPFRLL